MKKTTVIIIVVLVFIVVAVVVYLFTSSNKNPEQITKTTQTSGLGNIFANTGGGWLSALFSKNGSNSSFTQQNAQQVQQNVAGTISSLI